MKQDLALIEQFLDALWLERNGGEYAQRLPSRFDDVSWWLHHRGLSLASVGSDDLQALLAERQSGGYKATSTARLLSAVRRFSSICTGKNSPGRSQRAAGLAEATAAAAKRSQ